MYRLPFGHGYFEGKLTHRLVWEWTNGPVPADMCVCHRCDNPPCVNPEHLFLGTKKANAEDMVSKGRSPRGEARPNAKLTGDNVHFIRGLKAAGHTATDVAWLFGVSRRLISGIWSGVRWNHLVRENQ